MVQTFFQASTYAVGIGAFVAIMFSLRYLIKIERSQKVAITKLVNIENKILQAEKKILNKLSKRK